MFCFVLFFLLVQYNTGKEIAQLKRNSQPLLGILPKLTVEINHSL